MYLISHINRATCYPTNKNYKFGCLAKKKRSILYI